MKNSDFFSASLSEADWLSILRGLSLAMQFSNTIHQEHGVDTTAFYRLSHELESTVRLGRKGGRVGPDLAEK